MLHTFFRSLDCFASCPAQQWAMTTLVHSGEREREREENTQNTICQTVKTHLNHIWIWIVLKLRVFSLSRNVASITRAVRKTVTDVCLCVCTFFPWNLSTFYSNCNSSLIDTQFKRLISSGDVCDAHMKIIARIYNCLWLRASECECECEWETSAMDMQREGRERGKRVKTEELCMNPYDCRVNIERREEITRRETIFTDSCAKSALNKFTARCSSLSLCVSVCLSHSHTSPAHTQGEKKMCCLDDGMQRALLFLRVICDPFFSWI